MFVSSFGLHVWRHPLRARARVGGGVERVGIHLVEAGVYRKTMFNQLEHLRQDANANARLRKGPVSKKGERASWLEGGVFA